MLDRPAARLGALFAIAGLVLVVATTLVFGSFTPGIVAFLAWACAPYVALLIAARYIPSPWAMAGAGAAALAVELGIRAAVFLFPRGSTAGIALVFSPALVCVALVAGALIGLVIGRAFDRGHRALGVISSVVASAALVLVVVGFARPELLPTAIFARRQMLDRLGDPRVTVGAKAFEWRAASDASAWYQAGAFDAEPGDELAVVDARGATLFDPTTLTEKHRIEFPRDNPRLWNWYSRLTWTGSTLVISQTGGGFQDTEVRDADGTLRWQYRPEPNLPPSALQPADLDADGRPEWYGITHTFVARLDGSGHEVWRAPAVNAGLLALVPPSGQEPAWVVAADYSRQVLVWSPQGETIAKVPITAAAPLAVVDFPDVRSIVFGGSSVRGVDLSARVTFELPLDGLAASQALDVRFTPEGVAHLALVTSAPRDVRRYRLQVWAADATAPQLVYEELLDGLPSIFKARTPVGDVLFAGLAGRLRALVAAAATSARSAP